MPGPSSTVAQQSQNFGSSINIISGIQGVSAGGNATVNMPVNQRIHRETFQCSGYGYRRSNGISPIVFTPEVAGTETFGNPTFVNGQIASIAITNAATAKGAGTYNITITPAPYAAKNGSNWVPTGATATYVVNGANLVTSVTVTNGGSIGPIPPELFMDSVKHLVNGIVMRDAGPDKVVKIAVVNQPAAYWPEAGEFPVFFTEPWRKIVDHDQATAWDLIGQSTYQIIIKINAEIGSPDLQGVYEFDYLRNARRGEKGPVLFLRPIKQHVFTYNVPQGLFNVTSLPIDFPIQRMWLDEAAGVGGVTHVELYQDGNKVLEGTYSQVNQMLRQYGFNPTAFSFSAVFDPDQRLGKALKVDDLVFRVYSSAPGALEILMEIQGDGYN